MRARTAWSLVLPILLVSEIVGHAFVSRAFGHADERHSLVARTAQEYLEYAYAIVAVFLVLATTALVRRAVNSFREHAARPLPSWRLAAIPSAAFLAQEHVERLVHDGDVGWLTAAEPAVLAGLALQLPCGLFAVWLVRTLLRAVDHLGSALARRASGRPRRRAEPPYRRYGEPAPLRPLALAGGLAERAPPAFA